MPRETAKTTREASPGALSDCPGALSDCPGALSGALSAASELGIPNRGASAKSRGGDGAGGKGSANG